MEHIREEHAILVRTPCSEGHGSYKGITCDFSEDSLL
jgi:hypothetical protein